MAQGAVGHWGCITHEQLAILFCGDKESRFSCQVLRSHRPHACCHGPVMPGGEEPCPAPRYSLLVPKSSEGSPCEATILKTVFKMLRRSLAKLVCS